MAQPSYETNVKPFLNSIPKWYKTMSVRQIALKLGVSKTTLYSYAKKYPELAAALDGGKNGLVDDLKNALKRRALGYDYTETTTKETYSEKNGVETTTTTVTRHMPPDLGSIHLLLKNLDPDWKNDDATTISMKRKELELKERKIEETGWT